MARMLAFVFALLAATACTRGDRAATDDFVGTCVQSVYDGTDFHRAYLRPEVRADAAALSEARSRMTRNFKIDRVEHSLVGRPDEYSLKFQNGAVGVVYVADPKEDKRFWPASIFVYPPLKNRLPVSGEPAQAPRAGASRGR